MASWERSRSTKAGATRSIRVPLAVLVGPDAQGRPSLQIRLPNLRSPIAANVGQVIVDAIWAGQLLAVDISVDILRS